MDALTRLLSCLFVLALLAGACTGSDDPDDADPGDDATEVDGAAADPSDAADAEGAAGGFQIPVLEGAEIDVDQSILDVAAMWIVEESGLSEMLQEELVLASAAMTRDVHHLTYEQQHDGVSVRGAELVVHLRDTGEVLAASNTLSTTLPGEGVTEEIGEAEAVEIATRVVEGDSMLEPVVSAIWLENGPELRLGWQVALLTNEGEFTVIVDATNGEVLSIDQTSSTLSTRPTDAAGSAEVAQAEAGCSAPEPPSACIYVVDPIQAAGTTAVSLTDADQTLVGVPLENLSDPGSGTLAGAYSQIFAQEGTTYDDPDGVWGEGGRADPSFLAGMIYYWIDYTQQLMQSLGYDYHSGDPVDVVPLFPDEVDNAFYSPIFDIVVFGVTSTGNVALAEDAQVVVHEYGHAILNSVVPDAIVPEARAYNEGFADLLMVFTTLEFRNTDIGCLSPWFAQEIGLPGGCIRRIDTDKVYPDDLQQQEHLDGEIFSGAVWDIFEAVLERDAGLTPDDCQDREANPCDEARDVVLGTLLGSLPFLTPTLSLNDAAVAMAVSDEIFYGGDNADIIAEQFSAHGFDTEASSPMQMTSGPMELEDLTRAESQLLVKIVHPNVSDLSVVMAALDPAGEPLCLMTLATPDSTAPTEENLTARYDLEGSTCEEFLPPSPERTFFLDVSDIVTGDAGQLFQFNIVHEGQTFVATGLPQTIPDNGTGLPASASIPTDEPGGAIPMMEPGPGGELPPGGGGGGSPAGTVTADIAISHTYIGDLDAAVLVIDVTTETAVCAVEVLRADPSNGTPDFQGVVDVSECAASYPPSAQNVWGLVVLDSADIDTGQVERFALTGPDGATLEAQVPVPIPDNDPQGALLLIGG